MGDHPMAVIAGQASTICWGDHPSRKPLEDPFAQRRVPLQPGAAPPAGPGYVLRVRGIVVTGRETVALQLPCNRR